MESFDDKQGSGKLLTGIAGRRDFTIVTIHKSGMSNAIGILRSIMGCFADAGVNVEHITSGIDSVSLAISSEESGVPCIRLSERCKKRLYRKPWK